MPAPGQSRDVVLAKCLLAIVREELLAVIREELPGKPRGRNQGQYRTSIIEGSDQKGAHRDQVDSRFELTNDFLSENSHGVCVLKCFCAAWSERSDGYCYSSRLVGPSAELV
jgi:hypothetical protein